MDLGTAVYLLKQQYGLAGVNTGALDLTTKRIAVNPDPGPHRQAAGQQPFSSRYPDTPLIADIVRMQRTLRRLRRIAQSVE